MIVTCDNEGCENRGIPIDIEGPVPDYVFCGPCGTTLFVKAAE